MSDIGFSKAFCGGIAAGVGTLGIRSVLLPDISQEDSLSTKKASFDIQESQEQLEEDNFEELIKDDSSEEQPPEAVELKKEVKEPVIPKCTFYVLKEPKREGGNGKRVVREILSKINQSQDQFLQGKSSAFIDDIKGICPASLSQSQNIYVWQESGSWIYSRDISTKNWLTEGGITIPESLKINSSNT
ncbi:hypothetical protein HF1_05270 [Mycoplasma haemofelis str. Langford 1]|uniref:Uncharacterized protein n=1 Tax=Mycoplasma haemofelis (strain Langford 1) TaxID=941640 RepID=E8ZHB4_MYCHL|nr:hypothetical protein [Mycoplasma haemofelis]CBY92535.1 hypothetical protein HF1_05270 [Mycoplasma haemofelis str. Langford 1]